VSEQTTLVTSKEELYCMYLGGFPAYDKQGYLTMQFTSNGIALRGIFSTKFEIAWNCVHNASCVVGQIQSKSAASNLMQAAGLLSAGNHSGGIQGAITSNALITAGSGTETKLEHIVEIQYSVSGVTGVARFKFDQGIFSNKRPGDRAVSVINRHRIAFAGGHKASA
jgi:hypothetical protein